jgi:hypothetical protein
VIACQVAKSATSKHTVDATLCQSDRRDFHRKRLCAGIEPDGAVRAAADTGSGVVRSLACNAPEADTDRPTTAQRRPRASHGAIHWLQSLAIGAGHADRQQLSLGRP